jgi:hypothetical protein
VPLQYFVSYPFENWSVVDVKITQTTVLKLDHAADPSKVRKVFEKVVQKDKRPA